MMLKKDNLGRVLLLGGSEINQLFYREKCVDELSITWAPVLCAQSTAVPMIAPGLEDKIKLSILSSTVDNNHIFANYLVEYT